MDSFGCRQSKQVAISAAASHLQTCSILFRKVFHFLIAVMQLLQKLVRVVFIYRLVVRVV